MAFTGEKGTVSPVTRKHHAKKMRLSVRLVLPVESAGGALFDAGAAVFAVGRQPLIECRLDCGVESASHQCEQVLVDDFRADLHAGAAADAFLLVVNDVFMARIDNGKGFLALEHQASHFEPKPHQPTSARPKTPNQKAKTVLPFYS